MMKKIPTISLIVFLLLLLFNIVLFFNLLLIKSDDSFSNDTQLFKKSTPKLDGDSLNVSFNTYINNVAFKSPDALENYFTLTKKNSYQNENIIEKLFAFSTDSLLKYEFDSLVYEPNVIKELIFWVEEFKYYKKNDTSSFSIIYPSIYDFWMNKIGNCVIKASDSNPNLKYDKRFNFIVNQLESKKYSIGIKFSSFEKLIDNITKSKWYYIYKRLVIETSFLLKVMIGIFIIITVYSYIYLFKMIIVKIKLKNKIK
jgi:hypothetical protein